VPQAAVTSGIQRTLTVNQRGPLSWLTAPDLGDSAAEKLHGMQEVKACIGLAVPSRPSCLWSPRTGALLVSATLEQRADLYLAVRPDTLKICQIALVSKETVVVSVPLLELRQVLRGSIP
jgi:hypothetical protein